MLAHSANLVPLCSHRLQTLPVISVDFVDSRSSPFLKFRLSLELFPANPTPKVSATFPQVLVFNLSLSYHLPKEVATGLETIGSIREYFF
jgi:hypothetical protein